MCAGALLISAHTMFRYNMLLLEVYWPGLKSNTHLKLLFPVYCVYAVSLLKPLQDSQPVLINKPHPEYREVDESQVKKTKIIKTFANAAFQMDCF